MREREREDRMREREREDRKRERDLLANGHDCLHFMTPHTHNQLHFRSNPNSHSVQLSLSAPTCFTHYTPQYSVLQTIKGEGCNPANIPWHSNTPQHSRLYHTRQTQDMT